MSDLEAIDLSTVTASVFEPHVDSEFTLCNEAGEFPATLIELSSLPGHGPEGTRTREPFGMVFKCDGAVLGQGVYRLTHPVLPPCDLFLSAIEGGDGWVKLEAVIN